MQASDSHLSYDAPIVRVTNDPSATEALGSALATLLRVGDIVLLDGDLGAGKTAFTRGIAMGFGVSSVSSPTFVVMNQYVVPSPGDSQLLCSHNVSEIIHIDAYRTTGDDELANIGWDHVFDITTRRPKRGVAVVEWPERLRSVFPPRVDCIEVQLSHASENERNITIKLPIAYWAPRLTDKNYITLLEGLILRPPIRCPRTGIWVAPTNPAYPFASEREQNADLFRWLIGPDEDEDDSSE